MAGLRLGLVRGARAASTGISAFSSPSCVGSRPPWWTHYDASRPRNWTLPVGFSRPLSSAPDLRQRRGIDGASTWAQRTRVRARRRRTLRDRFGGLIGLGMDDAGSRFRAPDQSPNLLASNRFTLE